MMPVENIFAPLLQNTSLHRHYVYGKRHRLQRGTIKGTGITCKKTLL